uniref:Uncharacterized protein n=1 Tax=Rhipicephalus zambeziensis TaxID=60191 RepID=A0A224Y6Q7_9ACAR
MRKRRSRNMLRRKQQIASPTGFSEQCRALYASAVDHSVHLWKRLAALHVGSPKHETKHILPTDSSSYLLFIIINHYIYFPEVQILRIVKFRCKSNRLPNTIRKIFECSNIHTTLLLSTSLHTVLLPGMLGAKGDAFPWHTRPCFTT